MKADNEIWVFLSHSNKDYEKVRIVRNILEEHGFRPLMFFLKCLDDDKNDDEVRSLIQREIDSRNRFILCDSPNAQSSDWVKEEVEYIQSKQRFYQTVDLREIDKPEKLAESILRFKKRATALLSYSWYDAELAKVLFERLRSTDFIAFDLRTSLTSEDYASEDLANSIKEVISKGGYFIALISNRFIESSWCMMELQFAIDCQDNRRFRKIIPVQIEKIKSIPVILSNMLNGIEIQDAYSNVMNEYTADDWIKNHSMSPLDRVAYNIMDILYWEDMKEEFLIPKESNHKKAWDYFYSGRRLFYHDCDHEGIDHAAALMFMKASYLGHVGAMRYLARCYSQGWGVVRDFDKAKELEVRASQNHSVYVCNDRRDPESVLWTMDDMNIPYKSWKDSECHELDDYVKGSIIHSKIVLFIASERSIVNRLIMNQLYYAITNKKRVIIVKRDEVKLPQMLSKIEESDIILYNPNNERSLEALLNQLQLSLW